MYSVDPSKLMNGMRNAPGAPDGLTNGHTAEPTVVLRDNAAKVRLAIIKFRHTVK